ncbi:MAG: cupin domain-containing protein [Oscillospiraceae bacterium]|nr:cupin domain-containing protein [Oscillospiraceae bacterium]
MVRKNADAKYVQKKMFDGDGMAKMRLILETNEEMYNKGRVFNHLYLEPGCEVGWHIHHGDGETYYILNGQGEYNDNGTLVTVGPGDVTFVDDGEGHSLKNNGDETLEAIALILFK